VEMPWRIVRIGLLMLATAGVIGLASVALGGFPSLAGASSYTAYRNIVPPPGDNCPLLGSTSTKAKRANHDPDCSFTLAENVMHHAAAGHGAIQNMTYKAIAKNKGKIRTRANRMAEKRPRLLRHRMRRGRRMVDHKKADRVGDWMHKWFKRGYTWGYIRERARPLARICAVTAAGEFILSKYSDGDSYREAGHHALDTCAFSVWVYMHKPAGGP
jgi:hypothetical protein